MKKLGVIRLFICLAAIITELLPLGAVLKYGLMSDNGHLIFRFENYSYFDVTPFGYAMFHYMICAVTTTITAMLSLLWIFFGKKRQTPITVLSAEPNLNSNFDYTRNHTQKSNSKGTKKALPIGKSL